MPHHDHGHELCTFAALATKWASIVHVHLFFASVSWHKVSRSRTSLQANIHRSDLVLTSFSHWRKRSFHNFSLHDPLQAISAGCRLGVADPSAPLAHKQCMSSSRSHAIAWACTAAGADLHGMQHAGQSAQNLCICRQTSWQACCASALTDCDLLWA